VTPDNPTQECSDPQIGALLVSYAFGTLRDIETERFEQHLLHCPACQRELEEAAPALEILAATREEFVLRAHDEKEDFESQYEQLARARREASQNVRPKNSESWIEALWSAVWGRKWMIGTVGVAAVAILFAIKRGPEFVPRPIVEKKAPMAVAPSTAQRMELPSIAPMASSDHIGEMQAKTEREIPSVHSMSELSKMRSATVPTLEDAPTTESAPPVAANESEAVIPESAADQITLSKEALSAIAAPESQSMDVSSKTLRMSDKSMPSADFKQIADIALGTFRPEQFMNLKPQAGIEPGIPSYNLERSPGKKSSGLAAGEVTTADTLFSQRRYDEARDQYEQRMKEDTTNAWLQMMVGVTSLAQGDYARAQTSLQHANALLPPGSRQDEVGLLLVRADLGAGRLDEAKNRLRQLAQGASDSSRKAAAQAAIVRIDSLESLPAPKPTPK
jgi:tetratricopeptide (TPR) repeat protein